MRLTFTFVSTHVITLSDRHNDSHSACDKHLLLHLCGNSLGMIKPFRKEKSVG